MARKQDPDKVEDKPTFPVAATMPKRIKLPKRAISKGYDPDPKPTGEVPRFRE